MEDDNSEAAESVASAKPPQGFQIQFEKTLPNPARPGLAAWSPKHDLLCFVTTNENVLLYRMNGQRVWGIAQRKDKAGQEGQVGRLQWRPDGLAPDPLSRCDKWTALLMGELQGRSLP